MTNSLKLEATHTEVSQELVKYFFSNFLQKWFMVKSTKKKNKKKICKKKKGSFCKKLLYRIYSSVDNVLVAFKKLLVHSRFQENNSVTSLLHFLASKTLEERFPRKQIIPQAM